MKNQTPPLILSARFTRAVDYARTLHTETRKGTKIPYMAHLFGVASLVMGEAGGPVLVTEDMVIAAILHDTVEDHGGQRTLDEVKQKFGPHVARLRTEPEDVLLISAADKLYNAKAILDDLKEIGPAVWDRFKRGPKDQLWYFHSLLEIFEPRLHSRMVGELKRVVDEIAYLVATGWPGEKAAPEPREI